eukprot:TCONS_00050552-protein
MTAADPKGEQTINRDAKTTGGVKGFASDQMNVRKWCLNRPKQADVMRRLKDLCGLDGKDTQYKPLRKSQVAKSEKYVQAVTGVLDERFLNPFGADTDKEECVYNLSSGLPFKGDADDLLNIRKNGEELYKDFRTQRLRSNEKLIHARLPKQKPTLFSQTLKKTKTKKSNSSEVIKANQNILGKLLTLSSIMKQPIDFEKALSYPLYDVPLSLAFPDGTKRSNQKSLLLDIIKATNSRQTESEGQNAGRKKDYHSHRRYDCPLSSDLAKPPRDVRRMDQKISEYNP